jgi:hypothetical protein
MARITYEEMRRGRLTDESVCLGLHKACRELRECSGGRVMRGKCGSKAAGENGSRSSGAETPDRGGRKQGLSESSRNVIIVEDDDETAAFHWVPYVHFGV